jgi:hypothetical protein
VSTTTTKPVSASAPSWRNIIRVHPAANLFPRMSPDELRALGQDIRARGLTDPITLIRQPRRRPDGTLHVADYELVLLDGINRLDAMQGAGFKLVRDGKLDPTLGHKALGLEPLSGGGYAELDADVDPFAFVISRNIQRRHLTIQQRRDVIAKLLAADPSRSDRQIAEMIKVDHHKIGRVRKEEEDVGKIPHVETRTDSRGREQPASKPKPAEAAKRGAIQPANKAAARPTPPPPQAAARGDIGPASSSELERLRARVEELQAEKRRLEIENIGLRSEIDELKARLTATPPAADGLDIPASLRRT